MTLSPIEENTATSTFHESPLRSQQTVDVQFFTRLAIPQIQLVPLSPFGSYSVPMADATRTERPGSFEKPVPDVVASRRLAGRRFGPVWLRQPRRHIPAVSMVVFVHHVSFNSPPA